MAVWYLGWDTDFHEGCRGIVARAHFRTKTCTWLPISVLQGAQDFGFVMGYTSKLQLRNYAQNPYQANR
jgi:hypothetical protein